MEAIKEFKGAYRWLSNFHPAPVIFEGMLFRSVEHAYQAAKTTNWDEREHICALKTAGDAKRAGRRVTMRADWDSVKLTVMKLLLKQKFADEWLRARLLATGDAELIEGNYWGDQFWGVCRGAGANHLGRLLMEVRAELRAEPAPPSMPAEFGVFSKQ